MKAIILAAGQGSRLRPLTDDRPKCMVEYRGKAIIDYIIDSLRTSGIKNLIMVKGYKAEVLVREGVKSYVNPNYDSTNMLSTLFCAEQELDDDVIVSYADIIYKPEIVKALLASTADFSVIVDKDWRKLWETRMEDPLLDAETMKLDQEGNIIELGKKPSSYEDIQGQYIGLFKISQTAISRVRDFYHSLDKEALYDGKDFDNMYMTSFIQLVISKLMPVAAVEIHGGWIEIDAPEDLECELS